MKAPFHLISLSMLLLFSSSILAQTSSETQHVMLLANVSPELTKNSNHTSHELNAQESTISQTLNTDNIIAEPTKLTFIEKYSDQEIAQLRQLFLQAENLLKNNRITEYHKLSGQLKDYPLYPFLQYQWLRKHLDNEDQIQQFLKQYSASRYAPILKRKWLHHLARQKQWSLFVENYSATKETRLNCYYHFAQLKNGQKKAGLEGAKKLWVAGKSQPKECDPLFDQLKQSNQLTMDLLWQRFDAALKNNKVSLAAYIKKLMPRQYHATAILWINLHNRPSHYMPQLLKMPHTAQSHLMFNHAINRLASKDIMAAIELWDNNKDKFNTAKNSTDKLAINNLEKKLALKLAFKGDNNAYDRLSQLSSPDKSSKEWRIRVAISRQNWGNVITAINALSAPEIEQEKWQYWLARSYLETDSVEHAQTILTALATKRSFYGYLAADKVNSLYQLSANPINVSADEISGLKNRDAFRVAFEFMVLNKNNEGKLQWWHAVRQLNKHEIIVAAKLAQQWQWDEIAIFTVAKAKHWDDIELRFPLSYADKIHENSIRQNLNPAILFGLVRRESAFNEKAYSPAGARGLMQIMPGTGRQIAKSLNERWHGSNSLYDPVVNLKYGSYYYQKLLDKFNGNYAIALAAYNAGPQRVKKWLPETHAIPADIWIETIPYKETRNYVINVLAYALIYQQRAQASDSSTKDLSMNELTRDVLPFSVIP